MLKILGFQLSLHWYLLAQCQLCFGQNGIGYNPAPAARGQVRQMNAIRPAAIAMIKTHSDAPSYGV